MKTFKIIYGIVIIVLFYFLFILIYSDITGRIELEEERVKVCEANNGEFYMYVNEPRCLIQDVSFEIVKVNDRWRLIVA